MGDETKPARNGRESTSNSLYFNEVRRGRETDRIGSVLVPAAELCAIEFNGRHCSAGKAWT